MIRYIGPPSRGRHRGDLSENPWSAQGRNHLLLRREPPDRFLGESEPALDGDLENAAAALAQRHLGGRVRFQDQGPRRDRPRLIASHAAIFDLNLHLSYVPPLALTRFGRLDCLASVASVGKKR
jgi:hypothetical protein